jgi:hypothetical protein
MIRIRSRTSCGTRGRPGWPRRILHLQNQRKPFRCQATTVSAWTIRRADFQSAHRHRSHTQKIRSAGISFSRFGAERRSTASCCRQARFSSRSWAEVLTIEARASNTVDRVRHADQRSKWKSINFNDYRWIRILWRHSRRRGAWVGRCQKGAGALRPNGAACFSSALVLSTTVC